MSERMKAIVSAVVIIIVQVAGYYGLTLDAGMVQDAIIIIIMLATCGYGIWKNHNFTEAAGKAQAYLDELKSGANGD